MAILVLSTRKSEKFGDYGDRFEAYVAANDIDNDKKGNVFLAVIGPGAYKLLKNLFDPENPTEYQDVYPVFTAVVRTL